MSKSKAAASPSTSTPAENAGVDDAVLPPAPAVPEGVDHEADAVETPAAPVVDDVAPKATPEPEPEPDAKAAAKAAALRAEAKAAALKTLEAERVNVQATYDRVQKGKAKLDAELAAAQEKLRAAKRYYNDLPE